MIKKLHGLILIAITTLTSFRYDSEITFNLGNKTCKISTTGQDEKLAKFISLHDNENTSVEAFLEVKSSLPNCRLYELKQSEERLLKYEIKGKNYLFDPNRIFSSIGIKGTILKYNQSHPKELENGLSVFADNLLRTIDLKILTAMLWQYIIIPITTFQFYHLKIPKTLMMFILIAMRILIIFYCYYKS